MCQLLALKERQHGMEIEGNFLLPTCDDWRWKLKSVITGFLWWF